MNRGITKENLLLILPPALTRDKSIVALAAADAEALEARLAEIDRVRVISNIDGLDEAVLDILARDFKVDWWDPKYSIEEKRRTLKDAWKVHRIKGTKAAVETAISAIYPHTRVLEWWEYGGEPYHFRLDINITNDTINSDKQRRVLQRLNYYKSLRSHNDGITYFVEAEPAVTKAVAGVARLWESTHTELELPVPVIRPEATVRVGAVAALWEMFGAAASLVPPDIRSRAAVRLGALSATQEEFTAAVSLTPPGIRSRAEIRTGVLTGTQEAFSVRIALAGPEPPKSTAKLRTGISSAWQENYTTRAITLPEKRLSAIGQAKAGGAVVSTQETATTHINLQEVDYGRTE